MRSVLQHNQYTFAAASLTVLVEEELVEAQAAGLLADEAVHVLSAMVVHGHSILERLDTRLQAEGHLGVAHRVSRGEIDRDMLADRTLAGKLDLARFMFINLIYFLNIYFRNA